MPESEYYTDEHGEQKKKRGSASPIEGRCGARLKHPEREGETRYCTLIAGKKTEHVGFGPCSLHSGSTPNALVSAERQRVQVEAIKMLKELGAPDPVGSPLEELLEAQALVKQWNDICMVKVSELREFEIQHSTTRPEQIHAVIELFERSMQRWIDTNVQLEKLNLMDRKLQLEIDQAQAIGLAIIKILTSAQLSLSDAQLDLARSLIDESMRELAPAIGLGSSVPEDAELVDD